MSWRTHIIEQITIKKAQLAAANAALDAALVEGGETQSYTFNSGEGQQSATKRPLAEIYDLIERLEAEIARLYRKLTGRGIVNLNLRRNLYGGYFGRY
jgi:hypothetical protein